MIKTEFGKIEKLYTVGDLAKLKEKNDYLLDTVFDMIELGIINGNDSYKITKTEYDYGNYLLEKKQTKL